MKIKWKNLAITIIYIGMPFIYVPLLGMTCVQYDWYHPMFHLFLLGIVQPLLIVPALCAIAGGVYGLFIFLFDFE